MQQNQNADFMLWQAYLVNSASVAQPIYLHQFSIIFNEFNKGKENFKSLSRIFAKDKGGTSPKYPRHEPKTLFSTSDN